MWQKLGEVTIEDPVCLVGLRPFIGAVDLVLSRNCLVVLAASGGQGGWTVYALSLPTAETLHADMSALATTHMHTTRHLLTEAHAILHTDQFLAPVTDALRKPLSPVYKTSCQRLADYFLM